MIDYTTYDIGGTNGIGGIIGAGMKQPINAAPPPSQNQLVNTQNYVEQTNIPDSYSFAPYMPPQPKQPKKKGGCFITTACIRAKKGGDDHEYLIALRRFRDNILLPDHADIVNEYYDIAPVIVDAITSDEEYDIIYSELTDIVGSINDKDICVQKYKDMVNRLKDKYSIQHIFANTDTLPALIGNDSDERFHKLKQICQNMKDAGHYGLYARLMNVDGGKRVQKHKHDYDHYSFLLSGVCVVDIGGHQVRMTAPDCLFISADTEHKITACTDIRWVCVHPADDGQVNDLESVGISDAA